MILKRWDYGTHTYKDFEVPDERRVATYMPDMSLPVDCASCGVTLPYGETFTSLEIHTEHGFGFGVCHECYHAEWERKKEAYEID